MTVSYGILAKGIAGKYRGLDREWTGKIFSSW